MQRFFATLFVLILSPLILLTLILVWLWDRNAPVFIQERIGMHKETFFVYKIRTMRDGKITGIGRVLRKTGIDELPQLFNIMKGEMNFVGPRPLTKADIVRLNWDSSSHELRWSVLPGITGMAQLVNVCDAQVSWDCDMRYIETRSVKTDLVILWKSFLVPVIGKQKAKQFIHKSTTS
ncbi:MAG: sugar transferase [Crocinitomicaceae bacterium]